MSDTLTTLATHASIAPCEPQFTLQPLAFGLCKVEPRSDRPDKKNKIPCNSHGTNIDAESYNLSLQDAKIYSNNNTLEIGRYFSGKPTEKGHLYYFIDLDDCIIWENSQPTFSPIALDLMKKLKGSFVEISLSGKGLHFFFLAAPTEHRNKIVDGFGARECYTEKRFVALNIKGYQSYNEGSTEWICNPELIKNIIDLYFTPNKFIQEKENKILYEAHDEHYPLYDDPPDDDKIIKYLNSDKIAITIGNRNFTIKELYKNNGEKSLSYDRSLLRYSLISKIVFFTGGNYKKSFEILKESNLAVKDGRLELLQQEITKAYIAFRDWYDAKLSIASYGLILNEDEDDNRSIPVPDESCYYGIIGDIANVAYEANNEIPKIAVAMNALIYIGSAIGSSCYYDIGDKKHHCNMFGLHIGRSGVGRKGSSFDFINKIHKKLEELKIKTCSYRSGGLSSGEGLVDSIHDGYYENSWKEKVFVKAVENKKLFLMESEFSNVLKNIERQGNTLSSILRNCWDGVSLDSMTKNNKRSCAQPHVSLVSAVTPFELRKLLSSNDIHNGFLNRFLCIIAEREKLQYKPKSTSEEEVDRLVNRLLNILVVNENEPDSMRFEMDCEAENIYCYAYGNNYEVGMLNDIVGIGDVCVNLLQRRAPMCIRLAMIFALSDMSQFINSKHICAALAWIDFFIKCTKHIHLSEKEEEEIDIKKETCAKILEFIKNNSGTTITIIRLKLFNNNKNNDYLKECLGLLLNDSPKKIRMEKVGKAKKYFSL